MFIEVVKKYTGKCPVSNSLNTIDVVCLQGNAVDVTNVYQKQSFKCNNIKCKHFLNQTCPVFKEIPFTFSD